MMTSPPNSSFHKNRTRYFRVHELELWKNLKAEGTTRLGIIGLADEAELVSLAVR